MKSADYCADIAKALEMGPTKGEWRPLHTRIDSACGYQILHLDLHGKTERERDANREYIAACHPAALRSILEEREQQTEKIKQQALKIISLDGQAQALREECERLRQRISELWGATKIKPVKYGCHCDLEPHMEPDGCVLDEGKPENCVYARQVARKEDCKYWQPVTIHAAMGDPK